MDVMVRQSLFCTQAVVICDVGMDGFEHIGQQGKVIGKAYAHDEIGHHIKR